MKQGKLKIKVCGMCDVENIKVITQLQPDYIGFIFYEKSPRFVFGNPNFQLSTFNFQLTKKVGVFVNESVEKMCETAQKYKLDVLQLHGGETPVQCLQVQEEFSIIKAFSIAGADDFQQTADYEGCCDYFLFDTKTSPSFNPSPQERVVYGGSGVKFDWQLLEHYQGKTPFFLSGGIDMDDVPVINKIAHPQLFGVDINSRFEISPGIKDIEKVRQFIESIK